MAYIPDIEIRITNREKYGTHTYEYLLTYDSWNDKDKIKQAIRTLERLYRDYWED